MTRLSRLLSASFGLALAATALAGSAHAESPTASAADFISKTVAPDIDDYWRLQSRWDGDPYVTPRVVLFDAAHAPDDGCTGRPVDGHAYCQADRTIYLDVG